MYIVISAQFSATAGHTTVLACVSVKRIQVLFADFFPVICNNYEKLLHLWLFFYLSAFSGPPRCRGGHIWALACPVRPGQVRSGPRSSWSQGLYLYCCFVLCCNTNKLGMLFVLSDHELCLPVLLEIPRCEKWKINHLSNYNNWNWHWLMETVSNTKQTCWTRTTSPFKQKKIKFGNKVKQWLQMRWWGVVSEAITVLEDSVCM